MPPSDTSSTATRPSRRATHASRSTAALAVVLRVEKPAAGTAVGLALAFSSVLWLTGVGSLDIGASVIAVNSLSCALYVVLAKPVVERVGALTLVTWAFTWGAFMLAPLGGLRLAVGVTEWGARGASPW
jgi:drug/metabolite transporter (DMT)-like permease